MFRKVFHGGHNVAFGKLEKGAQSFAKSFTEDTMLPSASWRKEHKVSQSFSRRTQCSLWQVGERSTKFRKVFHEGHNVAFGKLEKGAQSFAKSFMTDTMFPSASWRQEHKVSQSFLRRTQCCLWQASTMNYR
jgi:hypothetical protein